MMQSEKGLISPNMGNVPITIKFKAWGVAFLLSSSGGPSQQIGQMSDLIRPPKVPPANLTQAGKATCQPPFLAFVKQLTGPHQQHASNGMI